MGSGSWVRTPRWWSATWPAWLFLALTLLLTYPLALAPLTSTLPMGSDGDLFIWTLSWNTHALTHQTLAPFDANIFHPQSRTLAYSENMIGSTVFAAPVLWLTGNRVLAVNVVALASCVLCGLGAYRLARQVGLSSQAAALCGVVFAFSPARFFRITQLHLTTVQWVPFMLASAHGYLDTGRPRDLRWALLFFTLQCVTSGHGAVLAGLAALCLAAYRVMLGEPIAAGRRIRDVGLTGVLLLVPTVLVFAPYLRVQSELGLRRSLENWAVTPVSFFAAPTHVQKWVVSFFPDARVLERADAFLFPGFIPLALAAAALVARRPAEEEAPVRQPPRHASLWQGVAPALSLTACAAGLIGLAALTSGPFRIKLGDVVLLSARDPWRPLAVCGAALLGRLALLSRVPFDPFAPLRRARTVWPHVSGRWRVSPVGFYGVLGLVAFLLAVGPPLGIWPLVYWIPGLNFIRVPSRFMIVGVLSVAVLAAAGFERLSLARAPRTRSVLALVLGLLLVIEFAAIPLETIPKNVDAPPADAWLAGRPAPFAVAEVPLPPARHSGPYERRQSTYMLHSMAHWQRTVHGYSGFWPPFNDRLFEWLTTFPDEACLRALAEAGVTYIVVHTELYSPGEWDSVRQRIDRAGDSLVLEHVAGPGRVYSLHWPSGRRP